MGDFCIKISPWDDVSRIYSFTKENPIPNEQDGSLHKSCKPFLPLSEAIGGFVEDYNLIKQLRVDYKI